MNRTLFRLWIFALFGVLMSCACGAAEDIDPRLEKVLADWQKRQNTFRSVRYEVSGKRKMPKGSSSALGISPTMPNPRRDQPVPSQDLISPVNLTMLLDFERGRHRRKIRESVFHLNFGKLIPFVKEDTFDGSVAKSAMPREENPWR